MGCCTLRYTGLPGYAWFAGPFELRHLVRLLVIALSSRGEGRRFTHYRGHLARSLAKDPGLLLAAARLSLFAASSEIPKEYGEVRDRLLLVRNKCAPTVMCMSASLALTCVQPLHLC